jgi:hypothetical protein
LGKGKRENKRIVFSMQALYQKKSTACLMFVRRLGSQVEIAAAPSQFTKRLSTPD